MLVQINKREGRIERVRNGTTPVIELDLEPRQYVANVELSPVTLFHSDRVTTDWTWTAFVVTPLGE